MSFGSGGVSKVTDRHLAGSAFLYVRQSTLRQVITNTESSARQYALRQRAVTLGWPSDRIITIDTDQGQSGASAADREGFKRLVAEVGMGNAGIVLGLEVSRLARNNADWHRLLEICGLTGTLICDEDGLYDPADFNDRLLLGLKGAMSEAELHFLRARLRGGQLSKARRGELKMPLPVGLVYDPADRVVLDPDVSVQHAIRHLFVTFARTGSARKVVQTFASENLLFPARVGSGPHKGELTWMPLKHWRVLRTLHNPRYAGAYAYGRTKVQPTLSDKAARVALPREEWTTLMLDAHPAFITWGQFEANQKILTTNAQAHGLMRTSGPAREGTALLQGLTICGRCGKRMSVRYHQRRGMEVPDYQCIKNAIQTGGRRCLTLPGTRIDEAISQLLLDTLTPLTLEVALTVQNELETRADEADRLRKSNVERARHHAELARRRYLSVDPDNRLVADTLEADWNDALRNLQTAQETYQRATDAANAALTEEHKNRIRQLASDFPALWANPNTPHRERKRMIRLLIEDVTLTKTDRIHLHVRFRGGQTTSLTIPNPLTIGEARKTDPKVLAHLDELLEHHTDAETAHHLNQAGHTTIDGKPFAAKNVNQLRAHNNLPSRYQRLRAKGLLTLTETAESLDVHPSTIKKWQQAGLLVSYKANDKNQQLYEPRNPADPHLTKNRGRPLNKRVTIKSPSRGAV